MNYLNQGHRGKLYTLMGLKTFLWGNQVIGEVGHPEEKESNKALHQNNFKGGINEQDQIYIW